MSSDVDISDVLCDVSNAYEKSAGFVTVLMIYARTRYFRRYNLLLELT